VSIRSELERIYAEHGNLTPGLVLSEAQSPDSPLHTHFNWDDDDAANRWRLHQAADLIRRVKINVVNTTSDEGLRVRAWTSIPTQEGRQYRDTREVAADSNLATLVRDELMNELRVLREKLRRFDEFAAIVAVMDDLAA
jgi:hypothetical protein